MRMRNGLRIAGTALAALPFLALASAGASAECLKITGSGIGVTESIAKFMAEKALKDGIANRGMHGSGQMSMSCSAPTVVVTNCAAQQRACK